MHHSEWNIIRGETHCETVEDFFRNPYILRIIRKWYRVKYKDDLETWEKLQIWVNRKLQQKDRQFTQEFINFVKNIFQDEQDVEDFFSFMRSEYYDDVKKREKITDEYNPGQLTTAILAMREVMHQLWYYKAAGLNVSTETVKWVFQTRIAWVIEKAYEHMPTENHNYNTFASISSILERWYSPFSYGWEQLTFQGDTDDGILVSTFKSAETFEIHGLDSMDEIVVSRIQLLQRIKYIERIKKSLEPGSRIVLTKPEYDLFTDLSYEFQEEWWKGSFWDFLEGVKNKMYDAVPKLKAEDTTMQKPLQDAGLVSQFWQPVFRDSSEIEEWVREAPKIKGRILRVVSSN